MTKDLPEGPNIDPFLLTFQRLQERAGAQFRQNEFVKRAIRDGVQVLCIPERFAFDRRVIGDLREAIDRVDPDIIQTHGFKSHFLVRASGVNQGRVWVAFHHGYTKTTYKRALLAQLDRWSLRTPSQVVTVSEAFSRQLCRRGVPQHRITVLHNAADPDWLGHKTDDEDSVSRASVALISPAQKLVLAVGRLSKEKGFTDLVTAIQHLKEKQPELGLRVMIVGEGREREGIEKAVRRAGLQDQVELIGQVNDVRPYYRIADVLAISSLSEGSPNVLLEAMAAGVPVVATAVGGIPEIVTDGETALLVPARDPAALAAAIERLLCDPSLAENLASRAQDLIKTQYSPVARSQSLGKLYERLCLSTRSASES